jgi:Icc protein
MKLAHISDLHILPAGSEATAQGPSSIDVATAIADDLMAISDGLDLVVISGDLTDCADHGSFAAFEKIFARINLPIIVVPGNHDGPSGMMEYARKSSVFAEWDLSSRVVEIGNVRILGLNTSVDGLTEGALDDGALALVDQEVRRETDRRLLVVMHHPPLTLGLAQFDGFCRIEQGNELVEILSSAKQTTLILSGHVHRPYAARKGNIACFVAGSMIAPHDSALPFGTDPIRPTTLQDFYFIHDISADGRHVVTPQRVRGLVMPATAQALPLA